MAVILVLATLVGACHHQQKPATPTTNAAPATNAAPPEKTAAATTAKPPAPTPVDLTIEGKFGTSGRMPSHKGAKVVKVAPDIRDTMQKRVEERVRTALSDRVFKPHTAVKVTLGGPKKGDGAQVTVTIGEHSAKRDVVPAESAPEAITNLDHTLDHIFDELSLPKR